MNIRLRDCLALGVTASLLVSCSTSQSHAPSPQAQAQGGAPSPADWVLGEARVTALSMEGRASYQDQSGRWHRVRVGERLSEGDRLRLERDAICDLDLGENGPVVSLVPGTIVLLERLRHGPTSFETLLSVERGRILGSTQHVPKGSSYRIRTKSSLVGIPNE